jgi:HK97 family phage prohead protease
MKRELKFLNIPFEIKADSEDELIITGHGAIKGNIDSYGDVIVDGAFKKTVKEQGNRIAFCYQHDIYNPIAKIRVIEEDAKGLYLEVKISDAENDIKTKIREGILKEMSIGYTTMDSKRGEKDGKDVNFLTEIKLYEVSLVTIAANPLAMIESMKAEGQKNTDVIDTEFDRLINIERQKEKRFELMKLKALVMSLPLESKATEKPAKEESTKEDEPLMTKDEILTILST